jgi:hypothetical protein
MYEGNGEGLGDWPSPTAFKGGVEFMATTIAVPREIVDVIADEMACGVDRAVEYWMSQIDHALNDTSLTSLGRLYAVKEVVEQYKHLTGKMELDVRSA